MAAPTRTFFGRAESHQALKSFRRGLQDLNDLCSACADAQDGLRLFAPDGETAPAEIAQWLDVIQGSSKVLSRQLESLTDAWLIEHDQAAMASWAENADDVGQQLGHRDGLLGGVYAQLIDLCQQPATDLKAELAQKNTTAPLLHAHVDVELLFCLDESDPQFSTEHDNVLTRREMGLWGPGPHGSRCCNEDRKTANWLDYPHPWMKHQHWLTHDVLEHDHGTQSRLGVSELLRSQWVFIEMTAKRMFAFNLKTGAFVPGEQEAA